MWISCQVYLAVLLFAQSNEVAMQDVHVLENAELVQAVVQMAKKRAKRAWRSANVQERTYALGVAVYMGSSPMSELLLSQKGADLIGPSVKVKEADGSSGPDMAFVEIAIHRFGAQIGFHTAKIFSLANLRPGFSPVTSKVGSTGLLDFGATLNTLVKHGKVPRDKEAMVFLFLQAAEFGFEAGLRALRKFVGKDQLSFALILGFNRKFWTRIMPQYLLRREASVVANSLQTWLGLPLLGGASIKEPLSEVSAADVLQTSLQPLLAGVMEYLLKNGADPDYSEWNATSLKLACQQNLPVIVQLLLKAKADVTLEVVPGGRTALHTAVMNRATDALRVLLSDGRSKSILSKKDAHAQTALDFAVRIGYTDGASLIRAAMEGASHTCSADDARPVVLPPLLQSPPSQNYSASLRHVLGGWSSQVIPSPYGEICEIPTIQVEDLTLERFADTLITRIPLRIRGGADVQAMRKWTKKYVLRAAGETPIEATDTPYADKFGSVSGSKEMSLSKYVKSMMNSSIDNSSIKSPLGIFQAVDPRNEQWASLLKLIRKDITPFNEMFVSSRNELAVGSMDVSWTSVQFGLGPANAGAALHYHSHSYSYLFHGRKRWAFVLPPKHSLSKRVPREQFAIWDRMRADRTAQSNDFIKGQDVRYCVQDGGDAIVVPEMVAHATLNLAMSLGVVFEYDVQFSKIAPF